MKIENYRQGDVLPKFGGAFHVKSYRGKLYVAKWPKARGKNIPELTKLRNQWFKLANILANNTSPGQMRVAMKMAPHGALYPRDYLVSAMSGRLYDIVLDDGTRIYPMSLLNEISKDLDVFTAIQGGMLYRDAKTWLHIPAGIIGQALQPNETTKVPEWRPPDAHLGGLNTSSWERTTVSTSAYATKGWYTTLQADVKFEAVNLFFDAVLAARYFVRLCTFTGDTIASVPDWTQKFTATATSTQRVLFEFISKPIIKKGTRAGIIVTRENNLATSHPGVYGANANPNVAFPVGIDFNFWRKAKLIPVVGDVGDIPGTGFPYNMDVIYRAG